MFSPLATTLNYGRNDAVLVDPPLTAEQDNAVGDWIEATGRRLTHIFATHGPSRGREVSEVLADSLNGWFAP
jgi:glyoxylase-like metal-dependent hydrolase (beta-lactamase superfamily II)